VLLTALGGERDLKKVHKKDAIWRDCEALALPGLQVDPIAARFCLVLLNLRN
jgi:hypothetical protein